MKYAFLVVGVMIAVVLFVPSLPVHAEKRIVRVGTYMFPPAAYIDDDERLAGEAVELMDGVLRYMGYVPEFVQMPFGRCLDSMKDGFIPIMLPCAKSPERLQYMQYSDQVYSVEAVLWKRKGTMPGCWDEYADLEGLTIGASMGYSYGPEWDKALEKKIFRVDYVSGSEPEIAHFSKLLVDRNDMFVCERRLGEFIKEKYSPKFDGIVSCPKGISPVRDFFVPISRSYFKINGMDPDDFLRRFNEELAKRKGR